MNPWLAGAGVAAAGVTFASLATVALAASGIEVRAAESADGATLDFLWPEGEAAPALRAQASGSVLVVSAPGLSGADLASLAGQAPGAVALARSDPAGARIVLRRTMTAQAARIDRGWRVALRTASQTAPAPVGPVEASVSVGERPEFTRLSFLFPGGGATVTPLQKGQTLDLRFSRAAGIDVAPLNVSPPKLMTSARVMSKPGERLSLSLGLAPGVRQRHFVDGPRVIVDLLSPEGGGDAVAALRAQVPKPAAAAPKPAPAVSVSAAPARVTLTEEPGATRISVRWSQPVKAAALRRGEAFWIVFDQSAPLDITGVARAGRRHAEVETLRGEGYTALRIDTAPELLLSAVADGPTWTVSIASSAVRPARMAQVSREETGPGGARLKAEFGRSGVVRWVEDPVVGDRFAVAMLEGPAIGLDQRRGTLEAMLMPAAHGAGVEARADGVDAAFEGTALVVARDTGGLLAGRAISGEIPAAPPIQETGDYIGEALLQLSAWAKNAGEGRTLDVIADLERRAAAEGFEPGAASTARMNLARFLLANELAPETLGALRAAAINQPQLQADPEFRLMRAAANLMMGRLRDASPDLNASGLQTDASAALWRGYAAALAENWPEARRNLEAGRAALPAQPRAWRARFSLALADAALRTGDAATAESAIATAKGEASSPDLRAQALVMEARLAKVRGDVKGALAMFTELAKSRDEQSAVRANLEMIRIRSELGEMAPKDAAEALEALRFRWRGDALELETIQTLGHVYAAANRWREGLTVMRTAVLRFPNHPAARQLRLDMASVFEDLFLGGGAGKLEPIQALGLYYEFKDLTPFGPDGDRMVRQLAGRLAEMDLLDRAAELLAHQVENRLEGLGQAQIAVDLAAIYLADGKPEQAIAAINATRQPQLPADLLLERRITEANALVRLGRLDHAEELVEKDRSIEAQRLRAEIAWRRKDYPAAVAAMRPLLPAPGSAALTPDERGLVLRAGVAAALAEDERALADLSRAFAARMQGSPEDAAFELVTTGPSPGDPRLRETARAAARIDLMDRFLDGVRARMRAGGEAAPAAQAQAPASPAAAG